MKKLSIIIPTLNEEKTIKIILEKIISLNNFNYSKEIIIINDGSNDKSEEIINKFIKNNVIKNTNFIYIKNETNKGKGYSVKKGIEKATGDYFIIQDADLEYDPQDYLEMINKLENEDLDIIYGSRILGFFKYGFKYSYIYFLLGGLFLSFLSSILTFKIITDEPTCYKLFNSKVKKYLLEPKENGFEYEPAITILLIRKGFNYSEVPIKYFPRKIKEGKKTKLVDGYRAIVKLIKRRLKK